MFNFKNILGRLMMNVALFVFIILGLTFFCVRYLEKTSLFYPEKEILQTPRDAGLEYEEVWVPASGSVRLNGWYIPAPSSGAPTLLFLHGNAGNIGDRVEKLALFHHIGLNALIIDYRGYGKSLGKSTEKTLYIDAQAAYDFLVRDKGIPPEKIVIYGSSLGAAPGIALAAKEEVGGLIVDSGFTSAPEMGKLMYPFLPAFMMSLKLDNVTAIRGVTEPKLFLHSQDDEVVPFYLGEKLFQAAGESKRFIRLRGGHVGGYADDTETFRQGLVGFLRECQLLN